MRADSLKPMMRAHLDSLAAGLPQSAGATLASHEAMASQMLDAMGADMTAMGMKPDPAWRATPSNAISPTCPAYRGEPLISGSGRTSSECDG